MASTVSLHRSTILVTRHFATGRVKPLRCPLLVHPRPASVAVRSGIAPERLDALIEVRLQGGGVWPALYIMPGGSSVFLFSEGGHSHAWFLVLTKCLGLASQGHGTSILSCMCAQEAIIVR